MFSAILSFFTGLVGYLLSHLPASPFANLVLGGDNLPISKMLGWVNWLIPVQDMFALFLLWLAAAVTYSVIRWIIKKYFSEVTVERIPLT